MKQIGKRFCLVLAVILLCAAGFPVVPSAETLDEHLVFHYDFQGETDAERLANKVAGSASGSLTVTSPSQKSCVSEGYAFVHTAKGEYISAGLGADVQAVTGTATFFFVFRAEGDHPSSVGDIAQIGGTLRVAMDQNNKFFTRMGSKFATDAATQKSIATPVSRNAWIWVAVTMRYDSAGNVTEQFLFSTDEGATWNSSEFTLTGVEGMLATANDLLLGKVSRGIDDRGTSFYYRDLRLYDRILTEAELKTIQVPMVEISSPETPPTKDPTEEPDPDRDIADHLVVHYDFLGDTTEERLRDKAPAGVSREDLMMYSSIDENGNKDSFWEDGTVYISSKQSNFLFAVPGEDITGLKKSMTAFVVFQPTGDHPTNPGDFFTIDNNVRFGFHNANNALFSGVGTNFGGGGVSTTNLPRGQWIYAAISLIWDAETGKVAQTISYSLDGGKSYSSVSRVVSDIQVMYSNATYLIFGKIAPGMQDRGTNFRFQDIRIYNCALTEQELCGIQVEAYVPSSPEQPDDPNPPENPSDSTTESDSSGDTTNPPDAPATSSDDTASPSPAGGCASAVPSILPVLLLAVLLIHFRKHKSDTTQKT